MLPGCGSCVLRDGISGWRGDIRRNKVFMADETGRKQLKSLLAPIVFYMAEVAVALEYLHAHEIVYRDLKPENVMIDAEGHVRLADLGLAKRLGSNNRTATMCGTPGYLAPEQLMKKGSSFTVHA